MNASKDLIFVSGNLGKLKEITALIPDIKNINVDLPEIQELDPKKIIAAKIKAAFDHTNGPIIVDDTALYLDCFASTEKLSELPGPYIKWFLHSVTNTGLVAIAQRLGNIRARGETIIGYAPNPDTIHYFTGTVDGVVVNPEVTTTHSFGWDYIFKPDNHDTTLAAMPVELKNQISPRALAVQQLKTFLAQK